MFCLLLSASVQAGAQGYNLYNLTANPSSVSASTFATGTATYDPAKPKVTTTYYNASQYFQKASVTDQNGHISNFIVGTNQG